MKEFISKYKQFSERVELMPALLNHVVSKMVVEAPKRAGRFFALLCSCWDITANEALKFCFLYWYITAAFLGVFF
ncbi:MAG TPA: hypothetical protein DIT57_11395 [Enterococcus sp.]|nr:hypothetical protein [Enterococcus sp.]